MNQKKDHTAYYPLLIGQNNYIGNSTFRYTFPAGSISLNRSEIGLESISIPYSWFNITTAFNNRIFTIAVPNGAVGYIYNQVTVDQGFYTLESLNFWLQNWMIQNDLYLVDDATGNYIYNFKIISNETFYRTQINLYPFLTAAEATAAGYSDPTGNYPFATVSGRLPMVTLGDSNNFYKLLGFSPGTYNSATNLGNLVPQLSPVTQVIVQTINLDNKYSGVPSNLHAFTIVNTTFGSMIQVEPPTITFVDVTDCSVDHIDIKLVDQNYNPLVFQDTAVLIKLIIKVREIK